MIRTNELSAGRELDMQVALAIGWELRADVSPDNPSLHWYKSKDSGWVEAVPNFSTDIAVAFGLVDQWLSANRNDTYCFSLSCIDGDGWCCELKLDSGKTVAEYHKGDSAAVAICYAIIEAAGCLNNEPIRCL